MTAGGIPLQHGPAERAAWVLLLLLLVLLPLLFLPQTIEVYVVPKAAALWVLAFGAWAALIAGEAARGTLLLPKAPGLRALAGFCLAAAAATALSSTPAISFLGAFMRREGLLSLLAYAAVYMLAVRLALTSQRATRLLQALIVPAVPTGVYAVAQTFGFEFVPELNPAHAAVRAYGFLGNADFLGVYAALLLPVLIVAFLRLDRGWRVYCGVALFATVVALLFSYFRGGWLGAAAGIAVLAPALGARQLRGEARHLVVIGAVVAAAMATSFGLRAVQPRSAETGFARRAASIADVGTGTAATRLEMWPTVLSLVRQKPLLGFGPETFRGRFMPIRREALVQLEGTARWDRPHNALLYLATSTGLVGLAFYLAFFVGVVLFVFRRARSGTVDAIVGAGLAASAVAAFVADLFLFWTPATTPIVFAALGLAVVFSRLNEADSGDLVSAVRTPGIAGLGLVLLSAALFVGVCWAAGASLRGDWYAELGRKAKDRGRRAESVFYYDRAVSSSPWVNDYRWRAALGWEQAGFVRADPEALGVSAGILRDGLSYDPFDEHAYVQLGDVYRYMASRTGRNTTPLARRAYQRALLRDPYSTEARKGLARLLMASKDYAGVLGQALAGLRWESKDRDLLFLAAQAYEQMGDLDRAREYYARVTEADPTYGPALEGLRRVEGR